jgi:hypothetical protein
VTVAPRWLVVVLMLTLIATLVGACYGVFAAVQTLSRVDKLLVSTEVAVSRFPDVLDTRLSAESRAARLAAERESAAWRAMVAGQGDLARNALVSESSNYRDFLRIELSTTRGDILSVAKDYSAMGTRTTDAAIRLLDEYTALPARADERIAPWLDCRGNGACVQAQFTALLGASRVTAGETSKTMRAIREATPRVLNNVDRTTDNVARLTKPDSLIMKSIKLVAPLASGALFGLVK